MSTATKEVKSTSKKNTTNQDAKAEMKKGALDKAASDAVAQRELKYQYPENVKTGQQKKEFRRHARAAKDKWEKAIRALGKSKEAGAEQDLKNARKGYTDFCNATYEKTAQKEALAFLDR